jgi:serine/threonine protein phosphatase PrpC
MEQDSIKLQIKDWLSRRVPKAGVRDVIGLPVAIGSDIGNVREENQDRAVILRAQVSTNKSFLVGVLCDGMGGMAEGANCAALAVASFISSCIRNRNIQVKERLFQAVELANLDVYQKFNGKGGSTLSAFILDSDGNFEAINVGDSRIYVSDNREMHQISVDDTIAGQLNQHEPTSQLSHKLLQFVGIGNDIEPHLLDMPALDTIAKMLITSDGVHYLNASTLKSMLVQNVTPIELSKRLIHVAKWCGGHDNSTVIILSDLSSILSSSENVKTGAVQLWDAHGDVQFIGIEKNQPVGASSPEVNDKSNENDTDVELANGSVSSEKVHVKAPVKRKRKSKKAETESEPKKKPQLRIDFND